MRGLIWEKTGLRCFNGERRSASIVLTALLVSESEHHLIVLEKLFMQNPPVKAQ